MKKCCIRLAKNYDGSNNNQFSLKLLKFIQNNFVKLHCDSCPIDVYLKKNKISEVLCSHFNIEDRRKYITFLAYYPLLFQDR